METTAAEEKSEVDDGETRPRIMEATAARSEEKSEVVDGETHPQFLASLFDEARLLLRLALPSVAVQFSLMFIWTQTASTIGRHLGPDEMAGYSLASLTGSITALSMIVGVLSAFDTLGPQAYGAGNKGQVGILALRGILACAALLFPFGVILFWVEPILLALGQDPTASSLAASWLRVYTAMVPSLLVFNVIQRFLAAQEIVLPLACLGAVSCGVIHPLALKLLAVPFGFLGAAWALVFTQTLQVTLLLLYLWCWKPHDLATWEGFQWGEALLDRAFFDFVKLGLGGLLALSEWWFWEIVCFLAGKFGIIALSAHSVAYQLIPLLYMFPLGVSIGLSIRLGTILPTDVPRARRLVDGCLAASALLAAIMAILVWVLRHWIMRMFTTNDDVIKECEEIWVHVSVFVFNDAMFGINAGILRALGLQCRMGLGVVICLWCITLPIIYYLSVTKGGGLLSLWRVMPPAYIGFNLVLILSYKCADWDQISAQIRERELSTKAGKYAVCCNDEDLETHGEEGEKTNNVEFEQGLEMKGLTT